MHRIVHLIEKTGAELRITQPTGAVGSKLSYLVNSAPSVLQTVMDIDEGGFGAQFRYSTARNSSKSNMPSITQQPEEMTLSDDSSTIMAVLPRSLVIKSKACGSCASNTRRVQITVYSTSSLFQQVPESSRMNMSQNGAVLANSPVIGIKVGSEDIAQLDDPVTIVLSPFKGKVSPLSFDSFHS